MKLYLEGEGGLKKQIRRRGVLPKGKKKDLQQMLRELVAKRMPITNEPDKNMEALGGFPVGSKWKVLEPILDVVEDPVNKFAFRPPTLGEDEAPNTTKHNYSKKFDRPVFTGRNIKGEVQEKGEVRTTFLRDEGLTVYSHPVDWLDAFLPVYTARNKTSYTPHHVSVEKICRWSNEKAILMEIGTYSLYPAFVPFITREFEQYMYLPFFSGLNPSPRVKDKLKTEETDPVQSNPFL